MTSRKTLRQIRGWIAFIIAVIVLNGIPLFFAEEGISRLELYKNIFPDFIASWIHELKTGISATNSTYPFLAYTTDWLAFSHLVIALVFAGAWKDPVRNKWVIDWAIICCVLALPLALIAGPLRGIPLFHRLFDCFFALAGLIPLLIIKRKIKVLES